MLLLIKQNEENFACFTNLKQKDGAKNEVSILLAIKTQETEKQNHFLISPTQQERHQATKSSR